MSNPTQLLYGIFASTLFDDPKVQALVKPASRIQLTGTNRNPLPENVSDANLPEVVLTVDVGDFAPSTSSDFIYNRTYQALISSGDMRLDHTYTEIEWHILRAIERWSRLISPVTWEGAAFRKFVGPIAIANGISDPEKNRNIRGWSGTVSAPVQMLISKELVVGRPVAGLVMTVRSGTDMDAVFSSSIAGWSAISVYSFTIRDSADLLVFTDSGGADELLAFDPSLEAGTYTCHLTVTDAKTPTGRTDTAVPQTIEVT